MSECDVCGSSLNELTFCKNVPIANRRGLHDAHLCPYCYTSTALGTEHQKLLACLMNTLEHRIIAALHSEEDEGKQ